MRRIHRNVYILSLSTWIASWVLGIINLLVDIRTVSFLLVFFSVILQACLSHDFTNKKYKTTKSNQKGFLDIAVSISETIGMIGMFIGLVSLLLSGGGPEIVDGMYCVMSHGDTLYNISQNLYLYLSACEYMLVFCGLLVFTTYMFNRIRNIYLLQNQAPNCKDL